MSITRRKFLHDGTLAGLLIALPLGAITAFGQSRKERDGNPIDQPAQKSDPLSFYSKAAFVSYLNSVFLLRGGGYRDVEVTLLQVSDMPAAKGGECFSLLFRGGDRALDQNTYTIEHPALGTFQLFLIPVGPDDNGAQGYLATINRLAPGTMINAPTKAPGFKTTPGTAKPDVTTKPAPATVPGPAAKPETKKPGRGKPSWKSIQEDVPEFLIDQ